MSDAQLADAQKMLRAALVEHEAQYKQIVATLYEEHFTEQDLRALAAFYRSDVGKKYIDAMPALIKELAPAATLWARSVIADAAQKASGVATSKGDHT